MTLGQRIKDLRLARGMKQYELADAAFITPSYISRIESGNSRPAHTTICNIAIALDVTPQDILCVEYTYRDNSSTAEKIKLVAEKLPADIQINILDTLESIASHMT